MSQDNELGPCIESLTNGPLRYRRGTGELARGALLGPDRSEIEARDTALLCRCGASERQPFCDGAHVQAGFTSERRWKVGGGTQVAHQGARITIHDDRSLCAHVEYCVTELPGVFDRSRRPWIDPDGASVEEIIALCDKCPSGALSYSLDGVPGRVPDRQPSVIASAEGPYFVEGDVAVIDPNLPEGPAPGHCTLCRCGASRNMPLCEGRHRMIGFTDRTD